MKVFLKSKESIFLTEGKWYDAELTPVMYDPNTLQATEPWYIVVCDDGKYRKFQAKCFITQEEWRNEQIKKIID